MKYANCREEVRKFKSKDFATELSQSISPIDRIIHTKDWGDFKVRRNGRIKLSIGNEVVRVQYKGSYFDYTEKKK